MREFITISRNSFKLGVCATLIGCVIVQSHKLAYGYGKWKAYREVNDILKDVCEENEIDISQK